MSSAQAVTSLTCPSCGRDAGRLTYQSDLGRISFLSRLTSISRPEPFVSPVVGRCEHCRPLEASPSIGPGHRSAASSRKKARPRKASLQEALSSLHWYRSEPLARIV